MTQIYNQSFSYMYLFVYSSADIHLTDTLAKVKYYFLFFLVKQCFLFKERVFADFRTNMTNGICLCFILQLIFSSTVITQV